MPRIITNQSTHIFFHQRVCLLPAVIIMVTGYCFRQPGNGQRSHHHFCISYWSRICLSITCLNNLQKFASFPCWNIFLCPCRQIQARRKRKLRLSGNFAPGLQWMLVSSASSGARRLVAECLLARRMLALSARLSLRAIYCRAVQSLE